MKIENLIKKILFFLFSSFVISTTGYYLLWLIMPKHYVFGVWYRMFLYHHENPIQYIMIPCFIYGIIASVFSEKFYKKELKEQIFSSLIIIILTILLSSILGGMLWNFHDMKAGYFPENWVLKLLTSGTSMGISTGWLIILLSVPYNILGIIVSFFLNKKGAELFRD